jgi:hypothetical protein
MNISQNRVSKELPNERVVGESNISCPLSPFGPNSQDPQSGRRVAATRRNLTGESRSSPACDDRRAPRPRSSLSSRQELFSRGNAGASFPGRPMDRPDRDGAARPAAGQRRIFAAKRVQERPPGQRAAEMDMIGLVQKFGSEGRFVGGAIIIALPLRSHAR